MEFVKAPRATIAVVMITLPTAAVAQEGASSRYHITPSDGGFVRLDTETGTVSHCLNRDGTWICEPAEEVGRSEDRLAELAGLVDSLTGRLDRLTAQVDTLQTEIVRLRARQSTTARPAPSAAGEAGNAPAEQPESLATEPVEAADDADGPSLASRLVAPLQQMVGDIKRGLADTGN